MQLKYEFIQIYCLVNHSVRQERVILKSTGALVIPFAYKDERESKRQLNHEE